MPETTHPGPREIFEHFQRTVLGEPGALLAERYAPDVVVEFPFAPDGRPRRILGRDAFLAFAQPRRAALPVRFEEIRNVVVHETADPEVIVAEYELVGTVTSTGRRADAGFVSVLRVRAGQIVHWREYQNAPAMAKALEPPQDDPPA
jgi:ketosteroid isomerase-like protein